jgi:serine protease Do
MRRWFDAIVGVVLALAVPAHGAADEPADLQQALALQRVMQRVIEDAEPAIACILVARTDAYERIGLGPPAEFPGKLGGFDPKTVDFHARIQSETSNALRKKLDLSDPAIVPESFGSGMVISPKGLILTNEHVIRGATKLFVRLPGNKGSYADIHASDPRSDLAVLRLLNPPPKLKTATLGDADQCVKGQFVLSIANPFAAGFRDGRPSASWGILSNMRRRALLVPRRDERHSASLQHFGILLQTDARLNLGCSGGALVNLKGEVIGLTTALAAIHGGETPGGFAIPINAAMRRIIDVLARGEEVEYGFLGVSLDQDAGPSDLGVKIEQCFRGSPADRDAKLVRNDRILAVNGQPIRENDDLFLALGTQLADTKVRLLVKRAQTGAISHVDVTLAKFYVPGKKIASSPGRRPFYRGLRADYTSLLVQENRTLDRSWVPPGVLVSEVKPHSPAEASGIKKGDIITKVNNHAVHKPADFYRLVQPLSGPIELTMYSPVFPPAMLKLNP